MKSIMLLLFAAALGSSALADETSKDEPKRYPVKGLTRLELGRVLKAASTNVADGVTISYVLVQHSSVSIGTVATRDGKTVAGHTLVFKPSRQSWSPSEKAQPVHQTRTTGLPLTEFISFVDSQPLGPEILSIEVVSESKLIVCTGYVAGPDAGKGRELTYEKQDGYWKKIIEAMWVS